MPYNLTKAPITIFASAARTATVVSAQSRIPGGPGGQYSGLAVIVDTTAVGVTPSVTFAVETSSGTGDAFASALTSAAVTAVGSTVLIVHPSVPTARANALSLGPLEIFWRVTATHGNATTITYSITAFLLR